jgi:uncharacterized protein YjbI with pentapeptide repeats
MMRTSGIPVEQPVSIWLKPLKVDFKDLFKTLGKVVINAGVGKFDSAISSFVDSIVIFKFKENINELAWLLIYRSISRAMFMLIEDNLFLIAEAIRGFQTLANKAELNSENLEEIAEKLNYKVAARKLIINDKFFNNPRSFAVIEDLKEPLAEWLKSFGLNSSQALSISNRLNSYFVLALNDEWRERRNEYDAISKEISTPFAKLADIEQQWSYYYSHFQKQIDESLFTEAFSLKQIFVPLRAYYEEKINNKIGKRVVDLENHLSNWVNNPDPKDSIRVISGGPGYGKSSVAKIFAAKQTENYNRRVLFIPLHRFELEEDLANSLKKFVELDEVFPKGNFLHSTEGEKLLLLIFDGLDELSMQGEIGNEVAKRFVREIQRKVYNFNQREPRLKVLICGRDIAVEAGAVNLDRNTKILHLLPYYEEAAKYNDPDNFLTVDQRDLWWQNYGKLTGKGYTKLPDELKKNDLSEITSLPLLNYLVALSFNRGVVDFNQETNLNTIYQDLLESVYQRDSWAEKQHIILQSIEESSENKKEHFFMILEEIALAAWHGGETRRVTLSNIEQRCKGALKLLLDKFQEKAKDGVASLLLAFYFRKSGINADSLSDTFEFTHKSFGEYLAARGIVRNLKLINEEIKRQSESYKVGYDNIQALTCWIELCGLTPIDEYILKFLNNEISLEFQKSSELVSEWQGTFGKLFSHVLYQGMPMEKLADNRPIFREEVRQSQNAEETLLAVLHACALSTKQTSNLDSNLTDDVWMSLWLNWVQTPISRKILSFLPLSQTDLKRADLEGADLEGADLHETNLQEANLQKANLQKAKLQGAKIQRAILIDSKLICANLEGADLRGANLLGANSQKANLQKANLIEANLQGANLQEANLTGANLTGANLTGANLTGANLTGANLFRAILIETNFNKTLLKNTILKNVFRQET